MSIGRCLAFRFILLLLWGNIGVLSSPPLIQATETVLHASGTLERLVDDFMRAPWTVLNLLQHYHQNGGFPNGLTVRDRDAFNTISYSLFQTYDVPRMYGLYYASEAGMFAGYSGGNASAGTYREPVNSGYSIHDMDMQQYYHACVDPVTGEATTCDMVEGTEYVQCQEDCVLEPCHSQQTPCNSTSDCLQQQKWCPKYQIQKASNNDLGFVPRTWYCHGMDGKYTQNIPGIRGDSCLFADGITVYAYCQVANKTICNDVFTGGFRSSDYDPRVRPWYRATRQRQMPTWTPPYRFSNHLNLLGITYSEPVYLWQGDRHVFAGVFSVDYTLDSLSELLVGSDGTVSPSTTFVIFEHAEPNYLIASSSGLSPTRNVNESLPCTANEEECMRVTMSEVTNDALQRAYRLQKEGDFPDGLVEFKISNRLGAGRDVFVSKSSVVYQTKNKELQWILLVVSPVDHIVTTTSPLSTNDTLLAVVCTIAIIGSGLCLGMAIWFYWKRKSPAVILTERWFTQAFLIGCALMNLSTFAYFLGEATQELCMLRMWAFPLCFSMAISPLFVKTYRLFVMSGNPNGNRMSSAEGVATSNSRRRPSISNPNAAALTLPIVLIQCVILVVFSLIDPPKPRDDDEVVMVEFEDDVATTEHLGCRTRTNAFLYTAMAFDGTLVLIGCGLAYATRDTARGCGQAKELAFAMYNVLFIAVIVAILLLVVHHTTGTVLLFVLGINCGTVFSSAVFVLPRLVGPMNETSHRSTRSFHQRGTSGSSNDVPPECQSTFHSAVDHAHVASSSIYHSCVFGDNPTAQQQSEAQNDHDVTANANASDSETADDDFVEFEPFEPVPTVFPYDIPLATDGIPGVSHIPTISIGTCTTRDATLPSKRTSDSRHVSANTVSHPRHSHAKTMPALQSATPPTRSDSPGPRVSDLTSSTPYPSSTLSPSASEDGNVR
ncbi:expressed unknown protein [Seminavis robusta]|uniref:G-protein coupled receptors family 3 profile domain-containing protein n=1 Tax=Seminavis robusta TaxID=568900 RepID=A0A9N8DJ77_9STRA|nr:expressed unknown protein [Seminavis robusta]|eukprot:Sro187_g080990.1 n/a (945) ;mRNA; f:62689-65640